MAKPLNRLPHGVALRARTWPGWLLLVVIVIAIAIGCLQLVLSVIGGVVGAFVPRPDPYKNAPKLGTQDRLDWANSEGKYAPEYRPPKPKPPPTNGVTGRMPRPLWGDDDYLDWANREGVYEGD